MEEEVEYLCSEKHPEGLENGGETVSLHSTFAGWKLEEKSATVNYKRRIVVLECSL